MVFVIVDHTLLAFHKQVLHGFDAGLLGLTGVWIFFVHTSLVLMWSLERKPFTIDFYVRRAFRIYPLVWVAIATVALTHARVTGYGRGLFDFVPFSKGNIVAASLLIYNLVPHHQYMPIEYVIWSLPLEVQMYVLLPVLFAFSRRDRSLLPLLLGWLLAVAIAYPFVAQGMQFITAIPDFLPGIMAFVVFKWARRRLPFWTLPLFLVICILVITRHKTIVPGWVFCLCLGLSLPFYKSLTSRPLQRLSHAMAKYSYGAYIAHPFALLLGVYLLRDRCIAVQLVVELVSILVISYAAYHIIERPMINLGSRLATRMEGSMLRLSAANSI